MKKKYTKRQILESIKYWKKQLDRMDESLRVSLADKQSATKALLDHIVELNAFVDQKPRPAKDELIQFIADIFKEEGLDTPWTRQFLIKMKMYTHGWEDASQYIYNVILKGQKLGMDQGTHHGRVSEGEELEPVNEDISYSGTFYNLIDELREYVLELKDYTYELQKLVKASDLNSHRSKFEVLSDSMTESLGELARFFAG